MAGVEIFFQSSKERRKANWLVKQFARVNGLVIPENSEAYIKLLKQRGLTKQYNSDDGKVFFPTDSAWDAFLQFVDLIYNAEPFVSKAISDDIFQAYSKALANMISKNLLPENYEDISEYLPQKFLNSLSSHSEIIFHKLSGVSVQVEGFLRIGNSWIGGFGNVSFCAYENIDKEHDEKVFGMLNKNYNLDDSIVSGGMLYATSRRIKQEDKFRCELGLGLLSILLNMTYQYAFSRLSNIRRIEKAEQGISKQFTFGFAANEKSVSRGLTVSTRFMEQAFEVDYEVLEYWHDSFLLGDINRIVTMKCSLRSELEGKVINAIMYFRQASQQSIPEMQIATLWVCVESLLTVGNEGVLETNLPSLLAITVWSLPQEKWPGSSEKKEQLEKIFKKHYKNRSKTFHHGTIGHVTSSEVQQFSIVVSNLVVSIVYLIGVGYKTTAGLLEASKTFLNNQHST